MIMPASSLAARRRIPAPEDGGGAEGIMRNMADRRRNGMGTYWKKCGPALKPLAFAAALAAGAAFLALGGNQRSASAAAGAEAKNDRPATIVQLTEAREMSFNESISADGAIKARFYALVSPRIAGTIDDVFVREGEAVRHGETKLFQIDNEKLQKAVDHSRQSLIIARSTLEEGKANLLKAEADLAQAEKDFARSKSLYEQKVVPLSEYEVNETKLLQLKAQLKVAETGVTLAEQRVTLAEIALGIAEKEHRDSLMYSPINGIVSARFKEPGEMGSTDKPVVRIDDTDKLKAVAYLPGQFYPRIKPGASVATVTVLDRKIGDFPVTYKAPAIDAALRTFEIWADIPGDGAYAVPGAQCVIKVILRESRGVGVPRDAVQFRDSKYWVFVPDGEKAKMLEVKPGLETEGWTELLESPLSAGDRVVTQGQFLLEDGYPIRERGK